MNFDLSLEQQTLVAAAREFALQEIAPYAAQWVHNEHIPHEQIQKHADAGYFNRKQQ